MGFSPRGKFSAILAFTTRCQGRGPFDQSETAMIQYLYLGRVGYDEGLRLQDEMAALVAEGRVQNVLLLLEHPPVLTLGRNAHRTNILASDELLARRGVTIHEINRGGDVTYHGPGQLVGYPIFDLRALRNPSGGRMGPVDFVRQMEEALIRLCLGFGVHAGRVAGLTGVWCGLADSGLSGGLPPAQPIAADHGRTGPERKIGAIGIHVSRGITSHGFAFNVTTDLRDFELIIPCGIPDHPVTSLAREVQRPDELPSLETIAHQAARQFGLVFDQQVLAAESLAALRAQAETAPASAPEFPAEDTPLQVPLEVERLRNAAERPLRA
jgi:lipoyl(octanoyl) transferase